MALGEQNVASKLKATPHDDLDRGKSQNEIDSIQFYLLENKGRADVPPNSSGFHRGERTQFPDLSNQVSDLVVFHRVVLTL